MSTVPLPTKRFVEAPAEEALRLGRALGLLPLADAPGEADPPAALTWALAAGVAAVR